MKPIEFTAQNLVLNPPAGTKRGECGMLPVFRFTDEEHQREGFASFWKPTDEEIKALNAGAHVRLDVWGTQHPPVWVSVQKVEELP